MKSTIFGFIYLIILGVIYGVVYTLNRKTPVPKGCENLKADCEGCHDFSCGNNPAHEQ